MKLKTGDYIYYVSPDGEHFPGRILKFGKNRIKVRINHFDGDKILWAAPSNIEKQKGDE